MMLLLHAETDPSTMSPVRGERFDLMIAVLTVAATLVAFGVAILTPPKGGPFCTAGCVKYPYIDIAAYIPRDFLWMYPALLPAPLFVILLSELQERAPIDRKRFGRVAVAFGAMADWCSSLGSFRWPPPSWLLEAAYDAAGVVADAKFES